MSIEVTVTNLKNKLSSIAFIIACIIGVALLVLYVMRCDVSVWRMPVVRVMVAVEFLAIMVTVWNDS